MKNNAFLSDLRAFEKNLQAHVAEIFCPIHLCLGAEEVPCALHEVLDSADWLFSYHRAHGHYMAKGGDMRALLDEIMGKSSGINRGFSGSQEFTDVSRNFHCSAIVGGLIGVATGAALALKMNNSRAVVVCVFGDAGVEQGVFWESINFAALHRLPIAYICENNGLSVNSDIRERQATSISSRVSAFGVNVVADTAQAVSGARFGVPTFYEAHVARDCDHINMATMPIGYAGGM